MVLCVVEGRVKDSKGVTGNESAEIMLSLGCQNAINGDGGGSSQMIVGNVIKNQLSDGKERNIGSALIIYSKGKEDKKMNNNKTVIIDIGHGSDTWEVKRAKAVVVNGKTYEEHDFNSKVGIELDKILKRCGFKTIVHQQPFSPEIDLTKRINYYNTLKADLIWSIHANAGTATAKGMASFYWHTSKEAKKLADLYAEEVKKYGYPTYGSGSRESVPKTWSDFAMCRDNKTICNLTENGFMTNPDDFKLIFQSDKYVKDVAEIHAKATCNYFGVDYVEEVKPTLTTKPPKVETPLATKEGGRKLNLTNTQFTALTNAYKVAHEKGILSSDQWHLKAANKTLTVDEATYLNAVIMSRLLK
jgi:N-acetylmuramoyl-L-alanine amidase